MIRQEQEYYMREALFEADRPDNRGGSNWLRNCVERPNYWPGHNLREHSQDATLHAEILAIQEANAFLKSWRLEAAQLFVTLEPCPMCSGAIINSRIAEVYYGAADPKAGTVGSLMNLLQDSRFNHQAKVTAGVLQAECADRLKTFFRDIRRRRRKKC